MGLALVVVAVLLRGLDPAPVSGLRHAGFDLWQRLVPREVPERPPGVVVDIDDASLEELGQWPWPRARIAEIVDRLAAAGVSAIAFDIVFAEPDRLSPPRYARLQPDLPADVRATLRGLPDSDERLAESLRGRPTLLGSAALPRPRGDDRAVPQVFVPPDGGAGAGRLPKLPGLVRNRPILEEAAAGIGVFSLAPGESGTVRRVPQVFRHKGTALPGLALGAVRLAQGAPSLFIRGGGGGVDTLGLGDRRLPVDRRGRLWLHFSPSDPARYISVVDLLNGDPAALEERLEGRVAILGTSAPGLQDIHATPLGTEMPGAEIQAQVAAALSPEHSAALKRPLVMEAAEFVLVVGLGLALALVLPRVGAWAAAGSTLAALGIIWGASGWAFTGPGLLLDAAGPSALMLAQFAVLTSLGFAGEQRQRRAMRSAFSRYISPALVAQLAERPEQVRLGGEVKELTVMLCDMRGFTTLSEGYSNDPQGLTRVIGRFFTALSEPVLHHKGTIDKYIGDALMAFWNAPLDVPGHEEEACRASLAMLDALAALNAALAAETPEGERPVQLGIGIGLNTGNCFVGNMGAQERFDYSVLGDPVNVASRLEGQSKTYGLSVICGPGTAAGAPDLAFLPIDRARLKGKAQALPIYALMGDESVAEDSGFQAVVAAHERFLAGVAAQDWAAARSALAEAEAYSERFGLARLHGLLAARLAALEAEPPGPGFDGATVALG